MADGGWSTTALQRNPFDEELRVQGVRIRRPRYTAVPLLNLVGHYCGIIQDYGGLEAQVGQGRICSPEIDLIAMLYDAENVYGKPRLQGPSLTQKLWYTLGPVV